ncbi:MAG: M67 family metallopeptidase [Acidobacteria bacterium]|nr:M67 family metallopeptidase [Acidobacteriota bacterium]
MRARIRLPQRIAERLVEEARRHAPLECCGLLGGHGDDVERILPGTNALASPVAYEIPPRELFDLFRRLREQGLELVGIYHSHPAGGNSPSARDIERAYYPEAAYLIVSPVAEPPIRAFAIQGGKAGELPVEVAA